MESIPSSPPQRRPSFRRWATVLTSVFLITCLLTNVAYGQGCSSAADMVADVWHEYGEAARKIGCATVGTGTAIVSGGVALPAAIAQYSQCVRSTKEAQALTEDMVEFYNEKLGKEGWGELGPRSYQLGTSAEGMIPSRGQRTFVTAPLGVHKTNLKIKKLAGRGETNVTVCSWLPDENGDKAQPREVWDLKIGAGKGTVGNEWDLTLSGLEGRILTVLFTGQSVAKRMKYRLSSDPYVTPPDEALKNFAIEYGYDRAGSDYRNFDLDTPDPRQCQAACVEDDRCKAFTYVKPGIQGDAARCWLKDEVAGRSEAPGLVSGIKGGASQKSGDVDMREVAQQTETPGPVTNVGGDDRPTSWTAVWRPGSGAQRWRTDMTLDELEALDQKHFQNGLRLVDVKVGDAAYGAVWRAGGGAQQWRTGMSFDTFQQNDGEYFESGLRLVDVEIQNDEYTAVWRAGSGAQRWHAGLSRRAFKRHDQTYFNQGLRLVDVEIDDGEYTAVWRAGSGAQRWHTGMTKDEIQSKDKKYFDQGLRLVDVEVDGEKYTAVWEEGTGGQGWRTEMSTDQFGAHDQSYFQDGFRLIDMETSAP